MKVMADRLRTLREGKRLSQSKMAEILGSTQASVNRYEHDTCAPGYDVLIRYADYFHVSADYLLGRTDNPAGEIYSYTENKIKERIGGKDKWMEFITACFDPESDVSAEFRKGLINLIGDDKS